MKSARHLLLILPSICVQAVVLLVMMSLLPASGRAASDLTQYVTPLMGTASGPNEYPGAQVPFGLLAWNPVNTYRGYTVYVGPKGRINWFSLSTMQGIGGSAIADVPHMATVDPCLSAPGKNTPYATAISGETASPGYYKVHLVKANIDVELAAATHSGIARYFFPASTDSCVVFDPVAFGNPPGSISIDGTNRMVTGVAASIDFGHNPHTAYYAAVFDTPFSNFGTWDNGQGFVKFDTMTHRTVMMKIAISYVSIANAVNNLHAEISDWNFDKVKTNSATAWNTLLNRIEYKSGATTERLQMFYTALYRTCQDPKVFSDTDGRYIGFDDQIHSMISGHKFYAGFSGWDVYRTLSQLMAIIAPDMASDYVRSLVLSGQQHGGRMPKWTWGNKEINCMPGGPSCAYIGSAYAFGATDIDLAATKDALIKYGTDPSLGWNALAAHMAGGYEKNQAVEMEACNADMGIATICQADNDTANYVHFRNRAQNIFNIWDPTRVDSFGGVGNFKGVGQETFIEEQIWCSPINYARLINLLGGSASAINRLDKHTSMMIPYNDQSYYNPVNEPGIHVPYVYNWLQVPWKTQGLLRRIMTQSFVNNSLWIGGLPKLPKPPCVWFPNDDCGTMSGWYVYMTLGLYPAIPGIGGFTITSPLFSYTIHLKNGNDINVTAKNASLTNAYIQSLTINGVASEDLWIPWDKLNPGANLVFTLGENPNTAWGSGAAHAPPSYGEIKE
jgi:putative alpha-1,2-mannosidase